MQYIRYIPSHMHLMIDRGTICLSHAVLVDYIINDEIHMGRNVRYVTKL